MLCGEGGDELFAGYNRHRNARNVRRWRPLLRALGPVAGLAPSARRPRRRICAAARRLSAILRRHPAQHRRAAPPPLHAAFPRASRRRRTASPRRSANMRRSSIRRRRTRSSSSCSPTSTISLPSAMLPRLDRASMAHSLEARVPFLSHVMVDWSLTLPLDMKLHGSTGKYVLRRAVADWLPPSVMRRRKQGFQMPLADWFKGGLGDFTETRLERQRRRASGLSRARRGRPPPRRAPRAAAPTTAACSTPSRCSAAGGRSARAGELKSAPYRRDNSRFRRRKDALQASPHARRFASPRSSRNPPAPAAVDPDCARHRHRRGGGDHDGDGRQRRHRVGADADRVAWARTP